MAGCENRRGCSGDHGGVVGAEFRIRQGYGDAAEAPGERFAKAAVASDAACDGEAADPVLAQGELRFRDEQVDGGSLKAGAEVGHEFRLGGERAWAAQFLHTARDG